MHGVLLQTAFPLSFASAELKEPASGGRLPGQFRLAYKMPSTKALILGLFLITIASIQDALGAHGNHHLTGSEIRRLGRHTSRGAAGQSLKGGEQANSFLVFIGIPSASQVTPMTIPLFRHRHPLGSTFYANGRCGRCLLRQEPSACYSPACGLDLNIQPCAGQAGSHQGDLGKNSEGVLRLGGQTALLCA